MTLVAQGLKGLHFEGVAKIQEDATDELKKVQRKKEC